MNTVRIFMGRYVIAGRDELLKYCRFYYGSRNQIRIVTCMYQAEQIVRTNISRFPKSVHQSVSVGHYLLHPNNREFNLGTRPALANHQLKALLLTLNLSTHTMLSQYISAQTSARFFFPF